MIDGGVVGHTLPACIQNTTTSLSEVPQVSLTGWGMAAPPFAGGPYLLDITPPMHIEVHCM